MPTTPPPTVEDAVATSVKRFRKIHGITQKQLIEAVRPYGVNWSPSSISNIESGIAYMGIGVLTALVLALTKLTKRRVSIRDLLGNEEQIRLHHDKNLTIPPDQIILLLTGGTSEPYDFDTPLEERLAKELGVSAEHLRSAAERTFGRKVSEHIDWLCQGDQSLKTYNKAVKQTVAVLETELAAFTPA